jgi:hypothetical protein
MRTPRVPFMARNLIITSVAIAALAGVAVPLIWYFASPLTPTARPPNEGALIMEGVDTNSNGPGHLTPGQPRGTIRPRLLPPDLHSGHRP